MKECCHIEDPKKDIKKLKIRFLIVGLVLLFSVGTGAILSQHPLHLSLTEISHNPRTSAVEVSVRIFSDDLQTSLTRHYAAPNLHIGEANESAETATYLARYLNDILQISLNGKLVSAKFVGHESKNDGATWAYLEITDWSKAPKNVSVQQKALCGLYQDQNNMVNIQMGEKRQSLMLTCKSPQGVANF